MPDSWKPVRSTREVSFSSFSATAWVIVPCASAARIVSALVLAIVARSDADSCQSGSKAIAKPSGGSTPSSDRFVHARDHREVRALRIAQHGQSADAGHVIATIGVKDLVIIQAGKAVLVARKEDESRVKEVVEKLKQGGHEHL